MTLDDSGDQAKGNPGFFINATNLKTDGIQLAGDLLGVIELGFGVCAGLKASEDESVIDTGDNAKVIGAGYQLTKCREVGVLGGSFDREPDTELAGCFILYNSHHACNNKISGGIEVSHIREPLPRERGCGDDGINPYCLNCNSIIADTNDSAGNADADFDTTGCIEFSLPLQHRSLSACDCGVVLEIYADEDKVNGCSEHPAKSHTMLQRDVFILGPIIQKHLPARNQNADAFVVNNADRRIAIHGLKATNNAGQNELTTSCTCHVVPLYIVAVSWHNAAFLVIDGQKIIVAADGCDRPQSGDCSGRRFGGLYLLCLKFRIIFLLGIVKTFLSNSLIYISAL